MNGAMRPRGYRTTAAQNRVTAQRAIRGGTSSLLRAAARATRVAGSGH